jgi:hypothetical protein
MKTLSEVVSVLACALSLNAQITAVLNRFPNRSPEVEIRNDSTVNLTAFAIGMAPVAPAATPFMIYVDAAIQPRAAMPLPPNQRYEVSVPGRLLPGHSMEDLYKPPIVTAAVFADGTTVGDAALLARLMLRRCTMLQAVELAIEMLSDAGRHNVSRGQLVGQFRMMTDSVRHWYLSPEQQVGRSLYQGIAGKLINLPELPLGSPFPPTNFVEEEIALLNHQRSLLLESRPNLADAVTVQR